MQLYIRGEIKERKHYINSDGLWELLWKNMEG